MMTYIYSFNLPSTDAIDFAYGSNDILQWQVGIDTVKILQAIFNLILIFLGERPEDKRKRICCHA